MLLTETKAKQTSEQTLLILHENRLSQFFFTVRWLTMVHSICVLMFDSTFRSFMSIWHQTPRNIGKILITIFVK